MSLSRFPLDILAIITRLIDALDIITLYKCGSSALNARLRDGGVKSFVYEPKPRLGILWPRGAQYFLQMEHFVVSFDLSYRHLFVDQVDILTIPKNVKSIKLLFDNSSNFYYHLEGLIAADPDRFCYKTRPWTFEEALFPNLTHLELIADTLDTTRQISPPLIHLSSRPLTSPIYLPIPSLTYLNTSVDRCYKYPEGLQTLISTDPYCPHINMNSLPTTLTELQKDMTMRLSDIVPDYETHISDARAFLKTAAAWLNSWIGWPTLKPTYAEILVEKNWSLRLEELEQEELLIFALQNPTLDNFAKLSETIRLPSGLTSLFSSYGNCPTAFIMALPSSLTALTLHINDFVEESVIRLLPRTLNTLRLSYMHSHLLGELKELNQASLLDLPSLTHLTFQSRIAFDCSTGFGALPRTITELSLNANLQQLNDDEAFKNLPPNLKSLRLFHIDAKELTLSSRFLDFLASDRLETLVFGRYISAEELCHPKLSSLTELRPSHLKNTAHGMRFPPKLKSLDLHAEAPSNENVYLDALPNTVKTIVAANQIVDLSTLLPRENGLFPLPNLTMLNTFGRALQNSEIELLASLPSTFISLGIALFQPAEERVAIIAKLPRQLVCLNLLSRGELMVEEFKLLPPNLVTLTLSGVFFPSEAIPFIPRLIKMLGIHPRMRLSCEANRRQLPPFCHITHIE